MKTYIIAGLGILLLVLFFQCCPSTTPDRPAVATSAPAHTEVPAPTRTPALATATPITWEPTPTGMPDYAVDMAYLECVIDIMDDGAKLMDDVSFTTQIGAEAPLYFCTLWDDAGLYSQAQTLERQAAECPLPTTPCFVETRALMLQGLEEVTTGVDMIDQWCIQGGNLSDMSLMEDAVPHFERSAGLMAEAANKMESCVPE